MTFPSLRNCTIAVIGLGYVGLPLAIAFAERKECFKTKNSLDRKIIGFDINKLRINQRNDGIDNTNEVEKDKLKNNEWIEDYYLQCAAYSLAHNVVYGSNIIQAVILLCTKDNVFQRFIVDGERLKKYQNKFLEKVEQFYAQRRAG